MPTISILILMVTPPLWRLWGKGCQTCQICLSNWYQNNHILHSSEFQLGVDPSCEVAFQVLKRLHQGHCLLDRPSLHLQKNQVHQASQNCYLFQFRETKEEGCKSVQKTQSGKRDTSKDHSGI